MISFQAMITLIIYKNLIAFQRKSTKIKGTIRDKKLLVLQITLEWKHLSISNKNHIA